MLLLFWIRRLLRHQNKTQNIFIKLFNKIPTKINTLIKSKSPYIYKIDDGGGYEWGQPHTYAYDLKLGASPCHSTMTFLPNDL
jgi:hypothetical protein